MVLILEHGGFWYLVEPCRCYFHAKKWQKTCFLALWHFIQTRTTNSLGDVTFWFQNSTTLKHDVTCCSNSSVYSSLLFFVILSSLISLINLNPLDPASPLGLAIAVISARWAGGWLAAFAVSFRRRRISTGSSICEFLCMLHTRVVRLTLQFPDLFSC